MTLYNKAIAAGLTKVTVGASTDSLINYQKVGKNSKSKANVACKGSDEQEAAFKASLEGAESENLEVEQMGPSSGDDCLPIRIFATATGEEKNAHGSKTTPKYTYSTSGQLGAVPAKSLWLTTKKCSPATTGTAKLKLSPYHPSERDLEADIKHLIVNDDLPAVVQEEGGVAVPRVLQGEELQQGLAQVEKIFADFLAANPGQTSPFFFCCTSTKKTADGIKLSASCISDGFYHYKQKGVIEFIGEQIKQIFPGVELRLEVSDPIPEIARGDKCVLCNKALSEADIQYLCLYCEPKHYHCQECEDLPREGTGSAKLAHPHKLYKITPLSSHFDELLFGSKIPQDEIITEDPADKVHHCRCDNLNSPGGCDGKVEGIRYKCAHCADFDFCEACEKLFWDTASEEMKAKVKRLGHFDHHVLIKIHFPVK